MNSVEVANIPKKACNRLTRLSDKARKHRTIDAKALIALALGPEVPR